VILCVLCRVNVERAVRPPSSTYRSFLVLSLEVLQHSVLHHLTVNPTSMNDTVMIDDDDKFLLFSLVNYSMSTVAN